MTSFYMGHRMLGDVIGFCAAAHLYSLKVGEPIRVWFDPARIAACEYFDGVVWTPHEEIPDAVDCGVTPAPDEWPQQNGVKRFYRFMDPTMNSPKSFDIHFNRSRRNQIGQSTERLIGLITHSNTQGDIDDKTLTEMLAAAKKNYPEHRVILFGNMDNSKVPAGVEDRRQNAGNITWIIDIVARMDLLISPHSGPCFIAAGWRIPMWVYRSKEVSWDYALNFDTHKVEKWWDRTPKVVKSATPLYINWRHGMGDAILHVSLYYHYARYTGEKLFFCGNSALIDRKMREFVNLARLEQPDIDEWIEQIPVERIRADDSAPEDFTGWIPIPSDNCIPEYWRDYVCSNFISCMAKVMRFGNVDRPADGLKFPHDYLHYRDVGANSNRVVFHLIGSTSGSYAENYEISRSDIITLVERVRDDNFEIVFLQPHDSWMTSTFPWATFRDHGNDLHALFNEIASARAVFAVDSGVAHASLCCGVPLYLFRKKQNDGLGFYEGDAEFVDVNTMLRRDFFPRRIEPKFPVRRTIKFCGTYAEPDSLFEALTPQALPGDRIHPQLLRLGRKSDGGYLVPRDPDLACPPRLHPSLVVPLVSFGVGWDISFELDWARMTGLPVICYDHTITSEQWNNLISGCGANESALLHHISKPATLSHGRPSNEVADRLCQMSRWALKMDIEGAEYDILEQHGELLSLSDSGLTLIVMELHWLNSTAWYLRAIRILAMLNKNWLMVHAHTNNYGNTWIDLQGNLLPEVVELTWLHRSLLPPDWSEEPSIHSRPLPGLDFPNNGSEA